MLYNFQTIMVDTVVLQHARQVEFDFITNRLVRGQVICQMLSVTLLLPIFEDWTITSSLFRGLNDCLLMSVINFIRSFNFSYYHTFNTKATSFHIVLLPLMSRGGFTKSGTQAPMYALHVSPISKG